MVTASRAVAVVLVAAATVLATACTRIVDDARVVAADSDEAGSDGSDCTSVDAPLTTVPSRRDDEPSLKIPQPEGWERVTMMDSELIRFTMRNPGLASDGFAANAVVTLESLPEIAEPREVFDAQNDALESGLGATDVRVTGHTLCGLPAETLHYTAPPMGPVGPHPASSLCAVLHTDDTTFTVSVTVQSADPGNPGYQHDAETILTGFQMLPPSDE